MQRSKIPQSSPDGALRRDHGEDDDSKTRSSSSTHNNGGGPGPGGGSPTSTRTNTATVTTTRTSLTVVTTTAIASGPAPSNTGSSSSSQPPPVPVPVPVPAPAPAPAPVPTPVPMDTQTPETPAQTGVPNDSSTNNNFHDTGPGTAQAGSPLPSLLSAAPPVPSGSSTSVVFLLNNPPNTTVCDTLLLSWSYVGQSPISLTLSVQAQNSPPGNAAATTSSTTGPSTLPLRILSTNISSNTANFKWEPVDVKEGWYNARAYDTTNKLGISASSSAFFVAQGSNTTCLLAITNPNQTPNSSSLPLPNEASHIPVGDIVGIVLGVTAGILGLITAFVLPRIRKRNRELLLDSPKVITKKQRPRLLY